ncbi:MAG: ferritin-like domain-containing protein [Ilumatobacteraceae bacterium]|nr:ferritin-like domain-containing protein [Ilumatobacteraceae bacterium]
MTYTLAPVGSGRSHAVLDLPDQNLPLELDDGVAGVRTLYRRAKAGEWNPATDIDWDRLDISKYTDEQLFAARQYWSRRAWGEYGAISESPALLLRYVKERREPDLAMFWTIRTQEEVRHADVCRRMADHLGGYLPEPVSKDLEGSVATHGVRGMSFDADTSLEAIFAALICCAEVIAYDVFRALIKITTDPVAKQILQLIFRDEVRHCEFGWQYMDYRVPNMTPAELDEVRDKVVWMMEAVELKGYHSAWLAPDPDLSEIEADRIVYEAGLGATVEELELPILTESVAGIRDRMRGWGIELPPFHHPKTGTF